MPNFENTSTGATAPAVPARGPGGRAPDTHEMVVVHRVFRRVFGDLPGLLRDVRDGDTARASVICDFFTEVATALHHHHSAEDEALWPLLLERMPHDAALVLRMEEQHERVAALLARAQPQAAIVTAQARRVDRERLATTIERLSSALNEHLSDEENLILPLVRRHITVAEWEALAERGRASIPKDRLLIQLGFILDECDPAEAREFLSHLPLPARVGWRLIGRSRYARERARIYGR